MKNTGDLIRLLLFVIAISLVKLMSVPDSPSATHQPKQEMKQVGRGADTTADKKLVAAKKTSPRLSNL